MTRTTGQKTEIGEGPLLRNTERVSLTVESCLEHFELVFRFVVFPVQPWKGLNKDREKKDFEEWHFRKRRIDHQNCGTENRNRRIQNTERASLTVDSCFGTFRICFRFVVFPRAPEKGHNKEREKGHKIERRREKNSMGTIGGD
ncbi:hypothetical protein CEXT_184291 [Caerostris extrusa]|uniref:Uncharacterized protein n=1 Tax=Caerostris extrusa TaxID=172846 RepID=A0AAV4MH88_CAEEX|nr:hypothetical protein CEXT_184291 [Caerostris extrusa]